MKLYYSVTSPYSRKALLTARAVGLEDQITLVIGSSMAPDTKVHEVNPLGKVPALVLDSGELVFDSPVIVEYFLKLAGVDRTSEAIFRQLQLQAIADGIMDAAVNIVMDRNKPDTQPSAFWQQRWESSILRSVALLESAYLGLLHDWQFGTIGTACALDYLGFRLPEVVWQTSAPKLASWLAPVLEKNEMKETDPRQG